MSIVKCSRIYSTRYNEFLAEITVENAKNAEELFILVKEKQFPNFFNQQERSLFIKDYKQSLYAQYVLHVNLLDNQSKESSNLISS